MLDYDLNSKIRAHCVMRNEQGYNSITGRSAIADVPALVSDRPKSTPQRAPTPPYADTESDMPAYEARES